MRGSLLTYVNAPAATWCNETLTARLLVQAAAVETTQAKTEVYNKNQFELYTLTTWLLQVGMSANWGTCSSAIASVRTAMKHGLFM
jgi:hypothetical protein